jgi:hypothetical protein
VVHPGALVEFRPRRGWVSESLEESGMNDKSEKCGIGRYVVLKASGSRFAYVNDTQGGKTIRRYDILKGAGKWNGWELAKAHAERLNALESSQ